MMSTVNDVASAGTTSPERLAAEHRGAEHGNMTPHHGDPAGRSGRFLDPDVDERFVRDGVVAVPLLTASDVATLRADYDRWRQDDDTGLVVDYMRPDRTAMRQAMSVAAPLIERALASVLPGYRTAMVSFVAKHPGDDSEMFLHEDRCFVDERKYRSMTVWIPLVDVGPDLDNGGLSVVPRSHLLPTGWSGSLTPDHIRPYETAIRSRLQPVEVAAGDAVIYDTRLLHSSTANHSTELRVAIACAIVPADADLIHVFASGRHRRRIHAVDDDFFLDHSPRSIEVSFPSQYRVIEELTDTSVLGGAAVAEVLGLSSIPQREPFIPWDMEADGIEPRAGRFPLLAPLETRAAIDDHQRPPMDPGFDDLAPPAGGPWSTGGRLDASVTKGDAWFAPADAWPIDVRAIAAGSSDDTTDQIVAVLARGARVSFSLSPQPQRGETIRVLHAPDIGAGILGTDRAAELITGHVVALPANELLTMWNDGPGPLVAVLERRATHRPQRTQRPLALLSRLASRRRPT